MLEKRRISAERRRLEAGYYDDAAANLNRQNQTRRRVFFLIGGVLLFFSFIGLILGFREVLKIREGGQWPQTPADITSTWVMYRSSRSSSYYVVVGRYEYDVNGQHYVRDADVSPHFRYGADAEQAAPTYAGQVGTIWYDPFEPARSQNSPITAALAIGVLIVSAGALIFGLLLVYRGMGIEVN